MEKKPFQFIAPPHTPFDADGALALDVVPKQAAHFASIGVSGVFVGGSTGESSSLTVEEREQLTLAWIPTAKEHGLRVFIHVGGNCQADSKRLAAHAQKYGADAIASLSPSYFKPASCEALVDHLAPIAASAAKTPFYYYDIPGLTGVCLPIVEVLNIATDRIPNLAGVKYTTSNLMELLQLLDTYGESLEILFGCDELLLPAFNFGVHGAVGSTYNWAAPHYREMITNAAEGRQSEANALQLKMSKMIEVLKSFGYMGAAKSMMKMCDIDCGPVRSPLTNLTAGQFGSLQSQIKQLDVVCKGHQAGSV